MPWKMKAEAGSGPDIDDGTYPLTVRAVEETVFEESKWHKGPRTAAKFTFTMDDVLDESGDEVKLDATASAEKLTPKTKLWAWTEALTGEKLNPGDEPDIEALVGCQALGKIVSEPDENGVKWARIKELIALPTTTKAGKAQAVEPATQQGPSGQQIATALGLKGQLQELWGTRGIGDWLVANCPDTLVPVGEGAKRVHTFSVEHLTMRDAGAAIIKLQDALGNERPPECEPDELPFEEPAK